jgi:hypothetical protein
LCGGDRIGFGLGYRMFPVDRNLGMDVILTNVARNTGRAFDTDCG